MPASLETPPSTATDRSGAPPDPGVPGLGDRLVAALDRRGLHPRPLAVLSLGVTGLAVFSFLVGHAGLGGLLGLAALGTGLLAGRPREGHGDSLARAAALSVDLVLLGAMLLEAAGAGSLGRVVIDVLLLLLFAALPYLSLLAPVPPPRLWGRGERLGVLLAGSLLGTPFPAALLVLLVCLLDAWYRTERLARASPEAAPTHAAPTFLTPLLERDGALLPVVRWASVVVPVLLLAVLPHASSWRF